MTLTSQSFLGERRSTAPDPATRQAGSGCVHSRRVHARLSDVGSRPHPSWLIAPEAHRLGFDHWLVEAKSLGGKPPVPSLSRAVPRLEPFGSKSTTSEEGAGHRHLREVPGSAVHSPSGAAAAAARHSPRGRMHCRASSSRGSSTYPRERVLRSFP